MFNRSTSDKIKIIVALNSAAGYKDEIYDRLKNISYRQNISWFTYFDLDAEQIHNKLKWLLIAKEFEAANYNIDEYAAILLPYLDVTTLCNIAHENFSGFLGGLIQTALLKNKPIYVLDYNCNPEREIFEVQGLNKNQSFNQVLLNNIIKCQSLGIKFFNLTKLDNYLETGTPDNQVDRQESLTHSNAQQNYLDTQRIKKIVVQVVEKYLNSFEKQKILSVASNAKAVRVNYKDNEFLTYSDVVKGVDLNKLHNYRLTDKAAEYLNIRRAISSGRK